MRLLLPDWDPYELEVVYPADPLIASSPKQIDVDIVAVHGLNIEGNLDHHMDTWTQSGVNWIKDLLPSVIEQRCRVMLFSWNLGRGIVEHDTYLARHSLSLLLALVEKRFHCSTRPLIFVCHDIGGLIVKDAIMTASRGDLPGSRAIFDATKMFIFFNTPHREPAKAARIIAEASLFVPVEAVVSKLERECTKFAARLEPWEKYRRLYNSRLVFNLHATNLHRRMKKLVDRAGTTLGLPDYWEKQYPIYGDHSTMCKFNSLNDDGCLMVVETIAMDLTRALKPKK